MRTVIRSIIGAVAIGYTPLQKLNCADVRHTDALYVDVFIRKILFFFFSSHGEKRCEIHFTGLKKKEVNF